MLPLRAGIAYALVLFALGFVLGTARVLLAVPLFGEILATLIELPLMLTAAYFICQWIIRRWRLPSKFGVRAAMALSFLIVLLSLEVLVGLALLGRTAAEQVAAFITPLGLVGLAAQTVSALFAFIVVRSTSR